MCPYDVQARYKSAIYYVKQYKLGNRCLFGERVELSEGGPPEIVGPLEPAESFACVPLWRPFCFAPLSRNPRTGAIETFRRARGGAARRSGKVLDVLSAAGRWGWQSFLQLLSMWGGVRHGILSSDHRGAAPSPFLGRDSRLRGFYEGVGAAECAQSRLSREVGVGVQPFRVV